MNKAGFLAALSLFAVPAIGFAAEYHYVDTSGTVQTINASNASEALAMPSDMAPTSGVALDVGVLDEGDTVVGSVSGETGGSGGLEYHYVDTSGTVQTIPAVSAEAALMNAPGIAPTSGVALDQGQLEDGDSVLGE